MATVSTMAEPEVKKAKRESSVALPSSVVQKILQSVPLSKDGPIVPFLYEDVVPEAPSQLPKALRDRISWISPEYAGVMRELVTRADQTVLKHTLESKEEVYLTKLYNAVASRGESLQCLSLVVGGERYKHAGFKLLPGHGSFEDFDNLIINWGRVFTSCPNLRRLDLTFMPLHSRHIVEILEATSRHCRNLEALRLPTNSTRRFGDDNDLPPLMETLGKALQRWFEAGTLGGLRQLCVPQRIPTPSSDRDEFVAANDDFMRHVTTYCPKIEYFDGYRITFEADESLQCDEFICCSLEVWEEFCKTCASLRELNWFVFAYLDPFFETFSKYPKHQLKKLIFAGGEHHNYRENEAGYYKEEMEYSSDGIASVFTACPALEQLEIIYMNEMDDKHRQDALTDDVLLAIGSQCPLLETIRIEELIMGQQVNPMKYITDSGLTALAQIPSLRSLKIKPTQCGAPGIFSLMEFAPFHGRTRVATVEIDVLDSDDSDDEDKDSRYETFLQLLKLMIGNHDKLSGRFFDVTVMNTSYYDELEEEEDSEEDNFTTQCVKLLTQLDELCPDIAVDLENNGETVNVNVIDGELTQIRTMRFVSPASMVKLDEEDFSPEWE